MKESRALVVAHVATSPAEAELIRSILEGAGLMAMVADRNMPIPGLDTKPFDGEYRGMGCEVVVRAEDKARAAEILEEARAVGRLGEDEKTSSADESEEEPGSSKAP